MMQNKKHIADFKLVAVDETNYYNEDLKKWGPIYGYYLLDMNLHVHVCSILPSVEARFCNNYFSSLPDFDTLSIKEQNDVEEIERGYHEENYTYFSTGGFDFIYDLEEIHTLEPRTEEYENKIEKLRDYVIGNLPMIEEFKNTKT